MKANGFKRKLHTRLAILTLVIGVAAMAGKIYADSEPGLIPLVLVASGMGWYFIARARLRARPVD